MRCHVAGGLAALPVRPGVSPELGPSSGGWERPALPCRKGHTELLTSQDAGLDVPDKPWGGTFPPSPPRRPWLEDTESPSGEKVPVPLTPTELRGRLDVAEGVQVDDIDHRAHHPCVVLPNNKPAQCAAWRESEGVAGPLETGFGALTKHFPSTVETQTRRRLAGEGCPPRKGTSGRRAPEVPHSQGALRRQRTSQLEVTSSL